MKLIFQPAEELPPAGEEGGAKMTIAEGALENPSPQAIFGLHVTSILPLGVVGYRPGPTMVVTVGMIRGGVRENIIPDSVEMRGTIRTFDEAMRDDIHERVTTLARVAGAGAGHLQLIPRIAGAEDFSFFQRIIRGLFFFVGVTPPGTHPAHADMNHSPRFFVDERALLTGVRSLAHLACDFLESRA